MIRGVNFCLGLVTLLGVIVACAPGSRNDSNGGQTTALSSDIQPSDTTASVGRGVWMGDLKVTHLVAYRQFLFHNQLCRGEHCSQTEPAFRLTISTIRTTGGYLPAKIDFSVQPVGYNLRALSRRTEGYVNGARDGILIKFKSNAVAILREDLDTVECGTAEDCSTVEVEAEERLVRNNKAKAGQRPVLQINTQFTNPAHTMMKVQVSYNGVLIAQGQMSSNSVQYIPTANGW